MCIVIPLDINILYRLETLPKQQSLFGNKQTTGRKIAVISPLSFAKRALSTTNDTNNESLAYLNKRRRITNPESNSFTRQVCNKQYFEIYVVLSDKFIIIK